MSKISIYFRILFSISLLVLLFKEVNLKVLCNILFSMKINFFLLALLLIIVDRIIVSYRWKILLKVKGCEVSLLRILRIDLSSNFIGTFLPSSAGGDLIKAYSMSKHISNIRESASSILVDRIISTFALLLLGLVGTLMSQTLKININYNLFLLILIIPIIFLMILFLFLNETIAGKISFYFKAKKNNKFLNKVEKLYMSLVDFKYHRIILIIIFILCLVVQSFRILSVYLYCLSLNINVPVIYFFIFIPIIYVLTLLPISINGIGVQEAAYVFFFSQINMEISTILAIPLVGYFALFITSIPGALIYVIDGFSNSALLKKKSNESISKVIK